MEICNFQDFLTALRDAGMTIGGTNGEDVFTLCDSFGSSIAWHTEDCDTDPWEWRIRVLNECDDIAYGKYFFKKSGYITKEWFPYFYAARRGHETLEEEYVEGNISRSARVIYELIEEHRELPVHLMKQYGGFTKDDKTAFDKAVTELQMKFYITMCGRAAKLSGSGKEYGWSSTVFCTTEDFFGPAVIEQAEKLDRAEAYRKIEEKIYRLNPAAKAEKVRKFILG